MKKLIVLLLLTVTAMTVKAQNTLYINSNSIESFTGGKSQWKAVNISYIHKDGGKQYYTISGIGLPSGNTPYNIAYNTISYISVNSGSLVAPVSYDSLYTLIANNVSSLSGGGGGGGSFNGQLTQGGTNVSTSNRLPVTGDSTNSAKNIVISGIGSLTLPVSATSLPLPTGAATAVGISQLHADLIAPLPAGTNPIGSITNTGFNVTNSPTIANTGFAVSNTPTVNIQGTVPISIGATVSISSTGVTPVSVGNTVSVTSTSGSQSNTVSLSTSLSQEVSTGSITTQNLVPNGTATAGSAIEILTVGANGVSIQVSGTYTGALSIQYLNEGTGQSWVTITGAQILTDISSALGSTIASAATGVFYVPTFGAWKIRITGLAAMTGSANITLRAFQSNGVNLVGILPSQTIGTISTVTTVTTLSQFLASAAASDATANPTSTGVRDFPHYYNLTTWDRAHGNYNTTTTDAGAKTVSFTGVTQTNFDSRGAEITILCGTVTGTSPTMTATIQYSPDAGTTWINYGPASGTVTATGNTILFQVYPTNWTVAGATPAALTTGATQTVQINGTLPRTWRLNYTIGGTSPSFTITGVYVNYQL